MATAKKKTAAKRAVKYAAKAQSSARQTSSNTAKAATAAGKEWMNKGAAEWQKGASDWAKQSAKLYQLPFAQGDVGAATKQAAENAVKMSNEFMQKMFSAQQQSGNAQAFNPSAMYEQFQKQMPNFDAASMQEKMSKFARESQEQMARASQGSSRATAEAVSLMRDMMETMNEVCAIASGVSKELAAEMIAYANKQFSMNVEMGKQVLVCRTLNDMFDLASRITKSNLDAFFSESVKISEKMFQCANDVSEPLNECMSEAGVRMTKAMNA